MEKWEIRPPLPQKPPNRSSPKVVWVTTSWTPTPIHNFIKIRLPPFAPLIRENLRRVTRLVFFWGGGSSVSLQPRPLHRFSRSIPQMTSFRARMCLLAVPERKFYILTPFSPKNANIFGQFSMGLRKFRVKKALTMGMLESKVPLIVIVATWKLYSERQIGVGELKYGVTGDPLFTGHVTQPNFGPKIGLKRP